MFGTLMLDDTGDLISAIEHLEGETYQTIGVALGSIQVAQACSLRVSTTTNSVWFNRAHGIDMDGLFYNTNKTDADLNPIRAQAFRTVMENTRGFGDYAGGNNVDFIRTGRKLAVQLPCFAVDCDTAIVTPVVIG